MGKLELVIESDHVSIYSPKYDGETPVSYTHLTLPTKLEV